MMPERQSDFLTQYKAISNKLKKKFTRKTNAVEPSNLLASLAVESERNDLPECAALAWKAVAQYESSQSNRLEEASAYLKAGRFFIEADSRSMINCSGNIQNGLSCLKKVEELWGSENRLTGGLCLEVGTSLFPLSQDDGLVYLEKSCSNLSYSPHLHIQALERLASAKILVGDYHGAVILYTKIDENVHKISPNPFGLYKDFLISCEIYRVILILLLQPTPQKISPELAKFVEKYTWIGEPDPKTMTLLGEELFFLLQSLVMSCQCNDVEAVHDLERDLWKYFSNEQRSLLQTIIHILIHSDK